MDEKDVTKEEESSPEPASPEETPEAPAEETPKEETPAEVVAREEHENVKAALREARKELKELKEQQEEKATSDSSWTEPVNDEEVSKLRKRLDAWEEKAAMNDVLAKYPVLKDKLSDFEEFKEDYPRHKLENVAKIFLAENDLLDQGPARQGLEKPTGGTRTPPKSDRWKSEDVKRLRETNFKEYQKLLAKYPQGIPIED